MSKKLSLVIAGSLYHSIEIDDFQYIKLALVGIDTEGRIAICREIPMEPGSDRKDLVERELQNLTDRGWTMDETLVLKESQFVIPGFIDTHIHAPQYVFTGTGYDLTLLKWLETYTFPREAAFKDDEYAKDAHARVVRKTLSCGTTTACYYATTHYSSSVTLAETCAKFGQRAYVGKVNMDRNSPPYYIEGTDESIKETIKFVKHVTEKIASPLITPCITPRFAPSCTPELMRELGEIAKKHNLPIQSHLSETHGEIAWVKELHPKSSSYADVYDEFGLLTGKTVMAHCVHLTKQERELLLKRNVGISHCASSNFCLHSGVLNVPRLLEEGYKKIGLGTDCAGGYSTSMLDSMRQALIASKVVHIDSHVPNSTKEYQALNFSQVFYMATLGGARAMDLQDKVGNFVVGKQFDALIIDTSSTVGAKSLFKDENGVKAAANLDVFPHDDHLSIFEKFVYLGDDRSIHQVYVDGKRVI